MNTLKTKQKNKTKVSIINLGKTQSYSGKNINHNTLWIAFLITKKILLRYDTKAQAA